MDASSLNLHLTISEHFSTDTSLEVGTDEDKVVIKNGDKNDDKGVTKIQWLEK